MKLREAWGREGKEFEANLRSRGFGSCPVLCPHLQGRCSRRPKATSCTGGNVHPKAPAKAHTRRPSRPFVSAFRRDTVRSKCHPDHQVVPPQPPRSEFEHGADGCVRALELSFPGPGRWSRCQCPPAPDPKSRRFEFHSIRKLVIVA